MCQGPNSEEKPGPCLTNQNTLHLVRALPRRAPEPSPIPPSNTTSILFILATPRLSLTPTYLKTQTTPRQYPTTPKYRILDESRTAKPVTEALPRGRTRRRLLVVPCPSLFLSTVRAPCHLDEPRAAGIGLSCDNRLAQAAALGSTKLGRRSPVARPVVFPGIPHYSCRHGYRDVAACGSLLTRQRRVIATEHGQTERQWKWRRSRFRTRPAPAP